MDKYCGFEFREDAEIQHTSEDVWYAVTNGYIDPSKLISGDQLHAVQEAIELLEDFFDEAESVGLIEFD